MYSPVYRACVDELWVCVNGREYSEFIDRCIWAADHLKQVLLSHRFVWECKTHLMQTKACGPACDRRRIQGYVPTSVNWNFLPCTLAGLQDHTQLQTAVSPTSLALPPCFLPCLINLLERHRVMGYQNEGQSLKPSQSSVGIASPWGSWRKWHRKESVLGYDVILAKAKRQEDIRR